MNDKTAAREQICKISSSISKIFNTQSLLFVSIVSRSTTGQDSFTPAVPFIWNSLPFTIRTSISHVFF